jgi:subtilisin family serine protease
MADSTQIPGIQSLWAKTDGDSQICVAVLDGLVDRTHPCFAGADLKRLPTLVQEEVSTAGAMSLHGTHVASIIFGQHGSEIARAIETAVNAGAHIINISGGQLTENSLPL